MATKEELQQEVEDLKAQLESQRANDGAGVPTLTRLANQGIDPSNTYEFGASGPVNRAVPEGAETVDTFEDAYDAGYFGYSAGAKASEQYTAAEAGKRNVRLAEARKAARNRSAAAGDTDPDAQGAQPDNG